MSVRSEHLRLMCILAHPDDESLGTGGILARYAAEGVATHLVTATRGERGWFGEAGEYPGPEALGRVREAELHAASAALGLHSTTVLDCRDGELDRADQGGLIARLAEELRRIRPQVVVTFDPIGLYGHPDHIAIAQLTTAAVLAAADGGGAGAPLAPHRVAKLYYLAPTAELLEVYQAAFGELVMQVDGVERRATAWPDWAVTTRIDASDHWRQVWRAVRCHRSQLPGYRALERLPEAYHRVMWGRQTFYRALSMVNGGREVEDDLFAGLR